MSSRCLELLPRLAWACPTSSQMRDVDRHAIEKCGVPSRVLMENAGRAVARATLRRFPHVRRPLVLCGGGNNGGDGFVAARALVELDERVHPRVLSVAQGRHSPDSRVHLEQWLRAGGECIESRDPEGLATLAAESDLLIDAVFGVGLSRDVDPELSELLESLSGHTLPVVAVDVPSGISSDTGRALGVEIPADLIVTFGLPKLGLALRPLEAEIRVA